MFGFSHEVRIAGIDFGTSSIKIVELTLKKEGLRLTNYGEAFLHVGTSTQEKENGMTYEARKKRNLEALLKKMRLKSADAYVALPGHSGLVALVKFPKMNDEELAQAVQYEAHKYVPMDMNEVTLSWEVLAQSSKGAHGNKKGIGESLFKWKKEQDGAKHASMEVLLVAALQKDVRRLEDVMKDMPVSIGAIELETFSMARSLVKNDPGTYLIIDIGYKICNMVLVHEGHVRMNRNVDVGGNDLTKTIADSMNISLARAEQLKKSGKNFFQQKGAELLFPGIELVINEAKRMRQAFFGSEPESKLNTIILSGGTALLSGLASHFSQEFGVPCKIGEPWRGIEYSTVLEPALRERSGSFAVAIGLALRGIEERSGK